MRPSKKLKPSKPVKGKGSKSMAQYYRTSITMPIEIADEINNRRGEESFSGQMVNDLKAYWEAVRSGMTTLRTKINRQEACYIANALDTRKWSFQKLDDMALAEIVEAIKHDGDITKYKIDLTLLLSKFKNLTLLELLALSSWSRTGWQRGDKPEIMAAVFPE